MEGVAWPEAEAHFQGTIKRAIDQAGEKMARRMRKIVYDAFMGGESVGGMADAIRRGMENDHGE